VGDYSKCLINALTGQVGTRSNMSGYPTNQELSRQELFTAVER